MIQEFFHDNLYLFICQQCEALLFSYISQNLLDLLVALTSAHPLSSSTYCRGKQDHRVRDLANFLTNGDRPISNVTNCLVLRQCRITQEVMLFRTDALDQWAFSYISSAYLVQKILLSWSHCNVKARIQVLAVRLTLYGVVIRQNCMLAPGIETTTFCTFSRRLSQCTTQAQFYQMTFSHMSMFTKVSPIVRYCNSPGRYWNHNSARTWLMLFL